MWISYCKINIHNWSEKLRIRISFSDQSPMLETITLTFPESSWRIDSRKFIFIFALPPGHHEGQNPIFFLCKVVEGAVQ